MSCATPTPSPLPKLGLPRALHERTFEAASQEIIKNMFQAMDNKAMGGTSGENKEYDRFETEDKLSRVSFCNYFAKLPNVRWLCACDAHSILLTCCASVTLRDPGHPTSTVILR
jgi:hypothetical protein